MHEKSERFWWAVIGYATIAATLMAQSFWRHVDELATRPIRVQVEVVGTPPRAEVIAVHILGPDWDSVRKKPVTIPDLVLPDEPQLSCDAEAMP